MLRDQFLRTFSFLAIFALFLNPLFVSAIGQKKTVSFERVDGSIDLVARGETAALLLDDKGLYIYPPPPSSSYVSLSEFKKCIC